jgi:hypothetical protein
VALTLGRLYDRVLRGDSSRDLDTVFVELVVLRAWGRRVRSDMGYIDVCVTFATSRPGGGRVSMGAGICRWENSPHERLSEAKELPHSTSPKGRLNGIALRVMLVSREANQTKRYEG